MRCWERHGADKSLLNMSRPACQIAQEDLWIYWSSTCISMYQIAVPDGKIFGYPRQVDQHLQYSYIIKRNEASIIVIDR